MTAKKPATKSAVRRAPRRQQARKYDPVKMFEWYCEDMTRSYADVAKQFGSTTTYIKKMAAREDTTWLERRQKVAEKLQSKASKRRYEEGQKRDESHLQSFRVAITANSNKIVKEAKQSDGGDAKTIATSTMALYRAIMGERIILGLPVLIARSEILEDDGEVPTLRDAQLTAERMAERAKELEDMRNNG